MSKPVPVYGGSPRPSSPVSALLAASRRLVTSRVALPVYGVSTTRATTRIGCLWQDQEERVVPFAVIPACIERVQARAGCRQPADVIFDDRHAADRASRCCTVSAGTASE